MRTDAQSAVDELVHAIEVVERLAAESREWDSKQRRWSVYKDVLINDMAARLKDAEDFKAWWVRDLKAKWAAKRDLHDPRCLHRDSEWPHASPGEGSCGKHMFPGETVYVVTYEGLNFGWCEECASLPTRHCQDEPAVKAVTTRCHTCGYHSGGYYKEEPVEQA